MNPAHRDRLAFLRIVSGEFEKGMTVYHSGTDKPLQLKQPQQFMADERESVENAYAGDIIGLFDPGCFRLGDSALHRPQAAFSSIPVFAPEHFARVRPEDSMKRKQFQKGILPAGRGGRHSDLPPHGNGPGGIFWWAWSAFCSLKYWSTASRREYGVTMLMDRLPFRYVRWVAKSPVPVEELKLTSTSRPRLRQRRSAGRAAVSRTNGPSVWRRRTTKVWNWPKPPAVSRAKALHPGLRARGNAP